MGLFSSNNESKLSWNQLERLEDIDFWVSKSEEKPVLFFKHSTRCGISSMSLNMFSREWDNSVNCELVFIDLVKNRSVSNAVSEKTKVIHQSPQIILISKGEVIHHASHSSIAAETIIEQINKL